MISFASINKQYGRQLLFVDASFQLNPGEKVGLVGPNGAGKTTIFRMIVGDEAPDDGEVSVPKKLTIGYFRQDVEEMTGRSVSANLLKRLNPTATFTAGEAIQVPNVMAAPEPASGAGVSIAVSKRTSSLTLTDSTGAVIYHAPVTTGSEHDPLPIGEWTVTAIVRNPTFNYNPDLFWDADVEHAKAKLPPGPNGPVGLVWIDLSKPHYGIHGTPEPSTVGHTSSHGCVRLTNWDAHAVAALIGKGAKVTFTE